MIGNADTAPLGEGEEMLRLHRRHLLVLVVVSTGMALLAGWFLTLDGGATALLLGLALMFGAPFLLLILAVAGFLISRDGWMIGAYFAGRRSHLIRWSGPLALIMLLLTAPAACTMGAQARDHALLASRIDVYRRIIADHEAGRSARTYLDEQGKRVSYNAEPGRPVRLYFELAGLADNSQGFVYDPSGIVAAARGRDRRGRLTAPPQVVKLFDGDLVWCRSIRAHYYRCGFT